MARVTKGQARQMAEELLAIRPVAERYATLEKDLKDAMVALQMEEIAVPGQGRVFVSRMERMTIDPGLARDALGSMANKVIEVKESVSNKLLEALVKTGDVDKEQYEQLAFAAKKTVIFNLYIRPLK